MTENTPSENASQGADNQSIDAALSSVREAITGEASAESPLNDTSGAGGAEGAEGETIELTAMIRPPKGYKSVKDYQAQVKVRASETPKAEEPIAESEPTFKDSQHDSAGMLSRVEESLSASLSLVGNAELQKELHEAIRPILQKWLGKNLSLIVNDILEDELKYCLNVLDSKKPSGAE